MVAGLNVIVFTLIAVLAHREKLGKKRAGELERASTSSEHSSPSGLGEGEKKVALFDVEEVNPAPRKLE